MDIENINTHLNNNDFEISGKYENDNFYMIHQGEPKLKGKRTSVKIDNNLIIWHTHPSVSKYYPSVEDICKILKIHRNQEIYLSIIFTTYGIWALSNFMKTTNISDDLQKVINEEINTPFYNQTNKGRTYNESEIQLYLSLIKGLINDWDQGYDFDIHFFTDTNEFQSFLTKFENDLVERLYQPKGGKAHNPKIKKTKKKRKSYKKTQKMRSKT
jgi:proteasome lid subunit RPN8/RPN11